MYNNFLFCLLIRLLLFIVLIVLVACGVYFIVRCCKDKKGYFRPVITFSVIIVYIVIFFANITVPFHNVEKSNFETVFYQLKDNYGDYKHEFESFDADDYGFSHIEINGIDYRIRFATENSCSDILSFTSGFVDEGKVGKVEYWITGVGCVREPLLLFPAPAGGDIILFDGTYTIWIQYMYIGTSDKFFPFFSQELFSRQEVDLKNIITW